MNDVVELINWIYFFKAWQLIGRSAEVEREKAQLRLDAESLLDEMSRTGKVRVKAVAGIYPAHAEGNDIIVESEHPDRQVKLACLRQQHAAADGLHYALADFIAPKDDFIGVFAVSVSGVDLFLENEKDDFRIILAKTLADRLAEASAEYLHFKVRTEIWAYSLDEKFIPKKLKKGDYQGIRPAIGYPSLPDQSLIFELNKLIDFNRLGIEITENGAMKPNASACGLYFAHPKAKYFMVGKIDENQLLDYARRRSKTPEEMRKWLAANI